jgi:hypothetical protein
MNSALDGKRNLIFSLFWNFTFHSDRLPVGVRVRQFKKLRASESKIYSFFIFFPCRVSYSSDHTRPRLPAHGQGNSSPRCHQTQQHTNCKPYRSGYELPYYEQQVRWHTNTHFIAAGVGLRWHFAFNMDSIISHAKSDAKWKICRATYIHI